MADAKEAGREPMSKVDTAWLRMESPTNLMMITAVLIFDGRLDVRKMRRLIGERFLAYRRFGQRAVDEGTSAFWETVDDLDLDWHVQPAELPAPARQRELEAYVSDLASSALDHARPLWQFRVVTNYIGAEGKRGGVLLARIHHCYADGMALVQVLLSLTDAGAPRTPRRARAKSRKVWIEHHEGGVFERLLAPTRAGLAKALEFGAKLLHDPELSLAIAREGGDIARELAVALTLSDDPQTAFKGPLGARKHCAWTAPMPLDEVKAVGKALGCTVNDVLLACAAGALRGYLREIGERIDGLTIRATVPVNLRPLEHAKKLGNHFGLVFLDLPIGEANPLRRLERVAACMRDLKRSKQAALTFGLLAAVGMAPQALQRLALELFARKASAVATNVPGPQTPLYMAGRAVRELMFWVPQNGSIGMGLSILSYNGNVYFGLLADDRRVHDPRRVVERFAHQFDKLALIVLMEDWDLGIEAGDAAATLARYTQ